MTSDLRWPGGKSAAAAFTFDVDAESAVLWGNDAVAARMSVMSHQAYGPLVGLPRILELLDTHQIPATFFVPGHTAHRLPAAVRRIVEAGHEIAHHGYLHEQPTALTLAQEIEALDRGLQALAEVAGVRPIGYRAPMWDLSWRTPELLLERGFLYDSSLMDADHPYELAVGEGSVVEIPIQWALDDWEQYCYLPDIA
ncbi:MAG: polysaccharide deacetylase family protein, partial [Mycobacterium sp.]|nr:polysaccharide deacetylase family protein [Mycobacterium sp.]